MNTPIYNCLIIDDEYLALDLLENYILRLKNFNIIEKISNPNKALKIITENKIDLLFLDIHMPQINGINLLKSLPYQPLTIFTTAYSDYGTTAYDLGVIDYLVKPFSFERFYIAIQKAELHLNKSIELENNGLQIKSDGNFVNILFHEIIFIEGHKEYIKIHCRNKTYKTLKSMSSMETLLSSNDFIRIHKSYIVSINSVVSFDIEEIELINNIKLPIARSKKELVIEKLKKINI